MTAAELMAELLADPDYVIRNEAREKEQQKKQAERRAAELPLLSDLRSVGLELSSVWDIVNSRASYAQAMPVLFAHLQRDYPVEVSEGIARAMAETAAQPYWQDLCQMYIAEPKGRFRDGLAVALAGAAVPENLDTIIELLRDARLGTSRVLLLSALERFRSDKVIEVLEELQNDPAIAPGVMDSLKKLRKRRR